MVVETLTNDEIDRIFHALADATRRDIVQRVIHEEQSVSTLARAYDVSFAAVQKHVAVLERAHLITKQRHGREQIVHSDMGTLGRAERLLRQYQDLWAGRASRMDALLAEDDETTTQNDPPSKGPTP
ncbi:transcriptional regulator [Frondihabitans sucicola]|uniref:Transcriptional regulator n=1 Tax=Frondihabitans sucicola TaxID=1268041 RepID=A0ABM8GUT9_9MICO|nr:helix-turn-helix domain-containing protein [Frondihabitans sucicola]BDZ52248.1 transcriptional regulator [Frondihabitans sucicola]